jgi:predicted class III extradiol MEMO1 family dioxygenase
MKTKACFILSVFAITAAWSGAFAADELRIPAMFSDGRQFVEAIEKEKPSRNPDIEVTGISVPHHLLAADLIARGFWAAAAGHFQRVIVVSPDHFNKSRRPLATTRKDIDTAFGTLRNDRDVTGALLSDGQLFDESDLFAAEHGVAALLPFVKHFFPNARIVPTVVSYGSTLIVQSTDYSHYLPHEVAQRRDQETLNVIAAADLEALSALVQPDHMDSKGSQYIQMRLQAEIRLARGTVIANRNSAEYGTLGNRTTSYIVTVYAADPRAGARLRYGDQDLIYFGGDVFIGRWLTQPLADPQVARDIVNAIRAVTLGAPMAINLEGLLVEDPPPGLNPNLHAMHASLALPILKGLNVAVAGYANNHSHDLGFNGARESAAMLRRAGITPLGHMRAAEIGRMGIVAINFIGAHDYKGYPVVNRSTDLDLVCMVNARSPLVAFVHWGEEYTRTAHPADLDAAKRMHTCGVDAVIGAHTHQAATRIEAMQGGEYQVAFSLGNLLFDQKGDRSSSALLELRLFSQRTFATRLVPLENLFELATARLAAKSDEAPPPAAKPGADDLPRASAPVCVGDCAAGEQLAPR